MYMPAADQEQFDAWLAMQPGLMDEFETEDVPQLPAEMYSAEGLDIAEAALLQTFPDFDATQRTETTKELFDKYARYLGETTRRVLGGEWRLSPDDGTTPLVYLPGDVSSVPFDAYGLAATALYRRSGHEWSKVLGRLSASD